MMGLLAPDVGLRKSPRDQDLGAEVTDIKRMPTSLIQKLRAER